MDDHNGDEDGGYDEDEYGCHDDDDLHLLISVQTNLKTLCLLPLNILHVENRKVRWMFTG